MDIERALRERDEARAERDLLGRRLASVRETLKSAGAPTHDHNGYELNANGMLVEYLAGERIAGWTGEAQMGPVAPTDPRSADRRGALDLGTPARRAVPRSSSRRGADHLA